MDTVSIQFILKSVLDAFNDAQVQAYQLLRNQLLSFLSSNRLPSLLVLFLILVFSLIKALNGRWGTLGSVLYNYFYWGILFAFGLIFGPKIFANVFIDIILFILYLACYKLVGKILVGMRLKK